MTPSELLPFTTLPRLGMSIGLALTMSACGEPAESALSATTFPSDVATPRHLADTETARRTTTTFPLLNGSYQLTFRDGGAVVGTIAGSYTGQAIQPTSGKATAALNLSIQGATGLGSSVTGLAADGTGAFTGEGEFTLALNVRLSTVNGPIHLKLQGTASISCSAQNRIVVTLRGTGSTPRLGNVEIQLQHEVENTFCIS